MHRVVIEKLDQVKISNDKNTDANNMGSIILVWHMKMGKVNLKWINMINMKQCISNKAGGRNWKNYYKMVY